MIEVVEQLGTYAKLTGSAVYEHQIKIWTVVSGDPARGVAGDEPDLRVTAQHLTSDAADLRIAFDRDQVGVSAHTSQQPGGANPRARAQLE